ncbi:hypothetical protein D3C85_1395170 [compost metagenome]
MGLTHCPEASTLLALSTGIGHCTLAIWSRNSAYGCSSLNTTVAGSGVSTATTLAPC